LYEKKGDYAQAEPLLVQVVEIRKQALGEKHSLYTGSLTTLAGMYEKSAKASEEREDFAAARKAREAALGVRVRLHGEKHWQVPDARLAVAQVERLARMTPEQRKQLAEADRLSTQASTLAKQGKFDEALRLAKQTMESHEQLYGEQHRALIVDLNNLGLI